MLFNWILVNKLAIGTPISTKEDLQLIKKQGIVSIIDLRNTEDLKQINHKKYIDNLFAFKYINMPLPDHKTGRLAETYEIKEVVEALDFLFSNGPVFVHCHASRERSPLICIAFLHLKKGLSIIDACDYVKQQNMFTSINIRQLKYIK